MSTVFYKHPHDETFADAKSHAATDTRKHLCSMIAFASVLMDTSIRRKGEGGLGVEQGLSTCQQALAEGRVRYEGDP